MLVLKRREREVVHITVPGRALVVVVVEAIDPLNELVIVTIVGRRHELRRNARFHHRDVAIMVTKFPEPDSVQLGFEAPANVTILRAELDPLARSRVTSTRRDLDPPTAPGIARALSIPERNGDSAATHKALGGPTPRASCYIPQKGLAGKRSYQARRIGTDAHP